MISKEIEELYMEHDPVTYSLNYTIAKPTKGQEFMFFSKRTDKGNINDYLKIVE